MPRKSETPFHKIVTIRSRLDMYLEYGAPALQGQSEKEFISEIAECFTWLMEFRNIINGMVSFDEPPRDAVLPYLDAPEEKVDA